MPTLDHSSDEHYMRQALRLARQSPSLPYPNPWVGCVIVHRGKIAGCGFHRGPGTSHAEVDALARAGARARGSTLYVNLEPCCHHGRTPPCTDAILRAGVGRVVYALRDPNPEVGGRGAAILKRQGVQLAEGVCAAEAAALNEVYLKFRSTGLPFVTAKVAATLDGSRTPPRAATRGCCAVGTKPSPLASTRCSPMIRTSARAPPAPPNHGA